MVDPVHVVHDMRQPVLHGHFARQNICTVAHFVPLMLSVTRAIERFTTSIQPVMAYHYRYEDEYVLVSRPLYRWPI